MDNNPSIVFFGTPDFAVESLQTLLSHPYHIKAVVTTEDKPAGRGLKIHPSPVKECAKSNHLRVLQPTDLENSSFIQSLEALKADLYIVIAFRKIPQSIWSLPPKGTINLHASLLPNYRGAAPIHHAIMNGEKETGVTIIQINNKIDSGDLLAQKKVPINPQETIGELYIRLKKEGARLLLDSLPDILSGKVTPKIQKVRSEHRKAPKITAKHRQLDFNRSCQDLYNQVRAMNPSPSCYFTMNEKMIKIHRASVSFQSIDNFKQKPGELMTDKKSYLKIACLDGYLACEEIQMQGKKSLLIADFLKGCKVAKHVK